MDTGTTRRLWNRSFARKICWADKGNDLRIQMHLPSRETEGVEIQVMLIKNPKAAQMIRGIRSAEPGMSAKIPAPACGR